MATYIAFVELTIDADNEQTAYEMAELALNHLQATSMVDATSIDEVIEDDYLVMGE